MFPKMSKKKPYTPTNDEIQKAPPRVFYELKMFRGAAEKVMELGKPNDPVLYNAALESALLHARNLLDFFTGEPTDKDDIHAAHFINTPKDKENRWTSAKMPLLMAQRTDLNYSISHLTYRRTKRKPEWDIPAIRHEVLAAFDDFKNKLPKDKKSAWER
jgi:hypothetical protein